MNSIAFYLLAAGTLIGLYGTWAEQRRLQRQINDLRRHLRKLEGVEQVTNRGIACGYAPLDGHGKIPRRHLPDAP